MRRFKRVHCVGIGGIGISAIARVLLEQGTQVSGSDLRLSPVADALSRSGATIYTGHEASHVQDADALLVSSAIPEGNPEVLEARRRGLPILKRAQFLEHLMEDTMGIAIAGTHGKTTTTAMIAWVLVQAGLEPTFIVGGVIDALHTNARAGRGPHFVIEADEYDRMFLGLQPTVAAITHLEHDHPDCYPTFAEMQTAFQEFASRVPPDGLIVGCADQGAVADLLRGVSTRQGSAPAPTVQTCGLGRKNDWQAPELWPNPLGGSDFRVTRFGQDWGCVRLQTPGIHNVQNSLIALVVLDWLDVDPAAIRRGLTTFSGVSRRFQVRGQVDGVTVVDDYGHHPTEIRATLAAAKARFDNRPVWAVFQPHTYSRTKALWNAFTTSFTDADHVIVLGVYPARETDTLGVSEAELVAQMNHPDARFIADFDRAADYVASHVEPGAAVVTLSAGDGNLVGELVLEKRANASH